MPKNIILCSDGTGNSGGKGHGTNVWRLYDEAYDAYVKYCNIRTGHDFNGAVR